MTREGRTLNLAAMSFPWPANADPATAWAFQTWSDLAARPDKTRALVILPVHGFADHGMGLPLDTEETLGSALLGSAIGAAGIARQTLVLPPFTTGAAPYAHNHFGADTETVLDALGELLAGVKASGFSRVLLFNTSPWNAELISSVALDARIARDLSVYVIGSSGIGLPFHPEDARRPRTQAAAAALLGRKPHAAPPADVRDAGFRPGFYGQPAPVVTDASLDGAMIFKESATALAGLLAEVFAHGEKAAPASAPISASIPPAPAGLPRSLAALTGAELAAIPDKARALVILPLGAVEQHGHHLPLGTDSILARAWLDRALPQLPADAPVFVAPPLVYGKSNEHLGFAGTISLSARTLRRQVLAVAAHLKSLGFRRLAVLNTHGGNSPVLTATLREIQTALGMRAGMLRGYYTPAQSAQEAAYGIHAGEWETSLLLAAAPSLVRMDRAVCEYPARIDAPGSLRPEGAPAVFAWKTSDVSRSGVMGDATIATAEKGARWLDEASAALARKITELLASA